MATEIFIGDAAFSAAMGFLCGALASGLGWDLAGVLIGASLCAAVFALLARSFVFLARAVFAALFFAGLIFGVFYYSLFTGIRARATHLPFGKGISLTAIIVDEPENSTKYVLAAADGQNPFAGELTIFAPLGTNFQYGDEIKVTGEIEAPETPGDTPAIFPKKVTVIAYDKGSWLRGRLIDFKSAILAKFNEVLSGDESALLGGETFGGSSGMSASLKNEMSASGTSYVLSMYGYKISMIIFLLETALAGLLARRPRFATLAGVIILFVVMSGGNVSAVRAGITAILALVAKLSGRVSSPRNALAFTATAMALFNPTLVVQASFALSFLSIVGIFYLADPLKNFLGWDGHDAGFLGWREAVVVAVASLLPIIPVIAAVFGDFSLSAFPSNILISIAILPAMLVGVALAASGFISHYLSLLIAQLAGVLFFYQFAIIKVFAAIVVPLPVSFNSVFAFAVYYGALGFFTHKYKVGHLST